MRENGETLQTLSAQISAAEAKIKQKNTVETQIETAEKNLRSYQDEIAKINVRVAGNNASLAENFKRVDELNGALQFASEEEARAATEAAEKKKKEIEAAVEAAEKARRESDTKIAGYKAAIETAKKRKQRGALRFRRKKYSSTNGKKRWRYASAPTKPR